MIPLLILSFQRGDTEFYKGKSLAQLGGGVQDGAYWLFFPYWYEMGREVSPLPRFQCAQKLSQSAGFQCCIHKGLGEFTKGWVKRFQKQLLELFVCFQIICPVNNQHKCNTSPVKLFDVMMETGSHWEIFILLSNRNYGFNDESICFYFSRKDGEKIILLPNHLSYIGLIHSERSSCSFLRENKTNKQNKTKNNQETLFVMRYQQAW